MVTGNGSAVIPCPAQCQTHGTDDETARFAPPLDLTDPASTPTTGCGFFRQCPSFSPRLGRNGIAIGPNCGVCRFARRALACNSFANDLGQAQRSWPGIIAAGEYQVQLRESLAAFAQR